MVMPSRTARAKQRVPSGGSTSVASDSRKPQVLGRISRSREIGRTAAELEARAEVLLQERDDLALHLAGVLGVAEPVEDLPVRSLEPGDLGPVPRF